MTLIYGRVCVSTEVEEGIWEQLWILVAAPASHTSLYILFSKKESSWISKQFGLRISDWEISDSVIPDGAVADGGKTFLTWFFSFLSLQQCLQTLF